MSEENKKQRKYFSDKLKRKILLEYTKGKKPSEIFLQNNIDKTGDKKYALKLIHKWKNEIYKNINLLSLNYTNIDSCYANDEINSIGKDEEIDNILAELLTKNNKNNNK